MNQTTQTFVFSTIVALLLQCVLWAQTGNTGEGTNVTTGTNKGTDTVITTGTHAAEGTVNTGTHAAEGTVNTGTHAGEGTNVNAPGHEGTGTVK